MKKLLENGLRRARSAPINIVAEAAVPGYKGGDTLQRVLSAGSVYRVAKVA